MKRRNLCFGFIFLFFSSLSAYESADITQMTQASFSEAKRLLLLDGDDGTVACRVYGHLMSGTIPRFSDNWRVELATRSLLRMRNLTAVRGVPGASMVGPADYFGNLEDLHKYLYVIKAGSPPIFYRTLITDTNSEKTRQLQPFDNRIVTCVKANWISGKKGRSLEAENQKYHVTKKNLRQSLFADPGLLEIDRSLIELRDFDARGVDLSSFKARLVNNSIPFQITKKKLSSKDDYRLVTYLYEPNYADWQIQSGSGLFLEKHQFSQTITPLTPNSRGFVCLARMNEKPDELELIAIQIPYGFTLIIEEECIHGDTTLNGFFMMGMTSDHTTMQTADTVFLKCPETKKNVSMVLGGMREGERANHWNSSSSMPQPPYVIYSNASESDREVFRQETRGKNFIFNPFSREYWHR